jgi:NAD(P)-dependent dehydrogenase (short-subunit alcohol dehydrogenase family)
VSSGKWSETDIGDQSGRVVLVTGANSGIGFEAARALAAHGAHVVLGCRNPQRAADAESNIRELAPAATVEVLRIDLSDLDSIQTASDEFAERRDRLNLLIKNAGLAMQPRSTTAQGFEAQLGVNHLGRFALTARLLPALLAVEGSRVVSISSYVHRSVA